MDEKIYNKFLNLSLVIEGPKPFNYFISDKDIFYVLNRKNNSKYV